MTKIFSRFQSTNKLNLPHEKPGPQVEIYHYTRETEHEQSQVHLRVEPDASGLLMVNANRVVFLNPTATLMARLVLEEKPEHLAIREIRQKFRVSKDQAQNDYTQFADQLASLLHPEGTCPIHDLDLEVLHPFSTQPSAPYRMDLAITYRCNNDCAHCYNARSRTFPELSTQQWIHILDQLWEIGIPHIVFTGGEPTLRSDLPDLIAHAQQNGQITGINTNGRRLSDPRFVNQLVQAGLDHVQITVESHLPEIHDEMVMAKGAWRQTIQGLRNALNSPLYVMTNTTMLQENSPFVEDTITFLAELGVKTIGLNALIYSGKGQSVGTGIPERDLEPLLIKARELTEENGQRLIWYTPTEYCHFDPMQLELGVKACTAARYNMCIEPDGSVLPCQSYYQSLGNFLDTPWEKIWNHPLALHLRNRSYIQEKCVDCGLLSECGGGCPLRINTNIIQDEVDHATNQPAIPKMALP